MEQQVVGYNGTFPNMLRNLLDRHPKTGQKTTLKELAEAVGIRQQTVSLYKNGETQPTPETLVKIAEFFDVSVDYLLTGVSSENKAIHEELGLSEEAINMLKRAKETETFEGMPKLIDTINELLSDRDLYEFLDDLIYKTVSLRNILAGNYDKSKTGNFDIEGYFIWDLQKYIEDFILRQLVKHGLAIEENKIEIKNPKS